nr:hypothetical protein [Candidatus Sigynarchaeota archaeon]
MRYTRETSSYIKFEQPVREMLGGERTRMQATMKRLWYCIIVMIAAIFLVLFAGSPLLLMGIQNIALGVGLGSLIIAILVCVYSLVKGPDPELVQVMELNSSTKDVRDWRYKRGKTTYMRTFGMQDITSFHLD